MACWLWWCAELMVCDLAEFQVDHNVKTKGICEMGRCHYDNAHHFMRDYMLIVIWSYLVHKVCYINVWLAQDFVGIYKKPHVDVFRYESVK